MSDIDDFHDWVAPAFKYKHKDPRHAFIMMHDNWRKWMKIPAERFDELGYLLIDGTWWHPDAVGTEAGHE